MSSKTVSKVSKENEENKEREEREEYKDPSKMTQSEREEHEDTITLAWGAYFEVAGALQKRHDETPATFSYSDFEFYTTPKVQKLVDRWMKSTKLNVIHGIDEFTVTSIENHD